MTCYWDYIGNKPHASLGPHKFHNGRVHWSSGSCCPHQGKARLIWARHVVCGRPFKLTVVERLFNFLLNMKHDNIIYMDSMLRNWSRSTICNDAIFVASCVHEAIRDKICGLHQRRGKIHWPSLEERQALAHQSLNYRVTLDFWMACWWEFVSLMRTSTRVSGFRAWNRCIAWIASTIVVGCLQQGSWAISLLL